MSGFRVGLLEGNRCPNCDQGTLKPINSAGEFVPQSAVGHHPGEVRSKCDACGWILTQSLDTRHNVRDPLRVNIPGSMW